MVMRTVGLESRHASTRWDGRSVGEENRKCEAYLRQHPTLDVSALAAQKRHDHPRLLAGLGDLSRVVFPADGVDSSKASMLKALYLCEALPPDLLDYLGGLVVVRVFCGILQLVYV